MRTYFRFALMGLAISVIGGCATATPKTDVCGPWKPIYVSADDVLTDGTARQISNHDETGAKLCHWQPTHHTSKSRQHK